MIVTLPTADEIVVLRERRARLQARLDDIAMGAAATRIGAQGGDVVEFGRASAADIRGLIAEIDAQLAGRPLVGAIGFGWS